MSIFCVFLALLVAVSAVHGEGTCTELSVGYQTANNIPTPSVVMPPGDHEYVYPDMCLRQGLRQVGIYVKACVMAGLTGTVRLYNRGNQIYAQNDVLVEVRGVEYCG